MEAAAAARRQYGVGVVLLLLATLIWGSTFLIVQETLRNFSGAGIIAGRFVLAALVLIPFLRRGRRLWRASIELGFLMWLGFGLQVIGQQTTTVGRSSFITSLNVIFVPIFAIGLGRRIPAIIWLAVLMAMAGAAVLGYDGRAPNAGDAWTLGCAIVFAFYIARLETFSPGLDSMALTAAQLAVVAVLSILWILFSGESLPIWRNVPWWAIIYLGLAATVGTTWLQAAGQKYVPAARAAVVYTMEPVWAVLFAYLVRGQSMGWQGFLGGGIIIAAAVMCTRPRPDGSPPIPAANPVNS